MPPVAAVVYDRQPGPPDDEAFRSPPLTEAGRRSGPRARVLRAMLVGLLVSVAVTALSRTGVLSGWETRAVDAFLFLRDRVPAPEIVLVLIDDDAFLALGQRQPLSRRYVADLADFLLRSGARVVAFDLVVTTPSAPAEDQALVDVARRWNARRPGSLVFASLAMPEAGRGGYALLPPFSPDLAALAGFANAPLGTDGVVRRFTPVLPAAGGGRLPGLSLAVLAGSTGLAPSELAARLAAPRGGVPLPGGARFRQTFDTSG